MIMEEVFEIVLHNVFQNNILFENILRLFF